MQYKVKYDVSNVSSIYFRCLFFWTKKLVATSHYFQLTQKNYPFFATKTYRSPNMLIELFWREGLENDPTLDNMCPWGHLCNIGKCDTAFCMWICSDWMRYVIFLRCERVNFPNKYCVYCRNKFNSTQLVKKQQMPNAIAFRIIPITPKKIRFVPLTQFPSL